MAINALVELAPHDTEVQKILAAHSDSMRSSLEKAVTAAQEQGQIVDTRPAELIAAIMMTFMAGIGAQLKGPMTKAEAHHLVDAQMQTLI